MQFSVSVGTYGTIEIKSKIKVVVAFKKDKIGKSLTLETKSCHTKILHICSLQYSFLLHLVDLTTIMQRLHLTIQFYPLARTNITLTNHLLKN